MGFCLHVCLYTMYLKRQGLMLQSCECWVPKPCFLEEQQVLLTAKMSLASSIAFFTGYNVNVCLVSPACLT